jgi:hypothetical protein
MRKTEVCFENKKSKITRNEKFGKIRQKSVKFGGPKEKKRNKKIFDICWKNLPKTREVGDGPTSSDSA